MAATVFRRLQNEKEKESVTGISVSAIALTANQSAPFLHSLYLCNSFSGIPIAMHTSTLYTCLYTHILSHALYTTITTEEVGWSYLHMALPPPFSLL